MLPPIGLRRAIALLSALVLGISPSLADEKPPVRTAQIDSHGRYPFGQFRGGYRYPFSYPYYRYGGTRHYPYSSRLYPFGVGPYGPYGSNYGGYSGNAYDPQVYGRPSLNGPAMPDAPPAPPAGDETPPGNDTPSDNPAQRTEGPPNQPAQAQTGSGPTLNVLPIPEELPVPRGPVPYFGGSPVNEAFGNPFFGFGMPYSYGGYPFGYFGNNYWFGPNRLSFGFGTVPPPPYYYLDGPPANPVGFNPQYAPPVYNLNGRRNYGPAYRTPGGVNLGPGHYDGW